MARPVFSSRMSVGSVRRHRGRINTSAGVLWRNPSAVRRADIDASGENKEQVSHENNDQISDRMYQVFDVCGRSPDSSEYYRVRWKGYLSRKYDTYEPASVLRSIGLGKKLQEVDEYMEWQKKYALENPGAKRVPTIYSYRKKQGQPTYAANEDFTCVLVALNTMTTILKINFVFSYDLTHKFGGKMGFKYSKLCKMVAYQRKILKEDFLSLEGAKRSRTKKCHNNTKLLMKTISNEPGVYLCGAGNTLGLYHTFVLIVRAENIYIFDEAFDMNNKLLSVDDLGWITRWIFVLKGTKGSHYDNKLSN